MRIIRNLMLGLVGATAITTSAQAITVTNLDTIPHVLHIEHIGGKLEATSIPPNGRYRYNGPGVWIAAEEGPSLKAIDDNDYVIWPGGKLRIQKYRKSDKDGR